MQGKNDSDNENDSGNENPNVNLNGRGRIRFKILHHEANRGLSAARNTGTDAATGDYIYYLDSDDEITADCIEKLVAYVLEDESIEMVQGCYMRTGNGTDVLGKNDSVRMRSNDEARHQFLCRRRLNYTVWNKLLKRSFVTEHRLYNKEGIINEDLLWTFYLIKYLNHAQLCEDVTYYYHIRPGSILSGGSQVKKGRSYVTIFDDILHHLTPGKEQGELKGYQTTFCEVLANYYRCVPELKQVLRQYKKQARRFGCWRTYATITAVALVSHFCNPIGILGRLNEWRMKAEGGRKRKEV